MANFCNNIESYFYNIKKISSKILRTSVIELIKDVFLHSGYIDVDQAHQYEPARRFINYPLKKHINDATDFAIQMATNFSAIDIDVLIAGCTLHDIDKYLRYRQNSEGVVSEDVSIKHAEHGGKLLKEWEFPEQVVHMVLSHSRSCSPIKPSTMEAIILRHADELVVELEYNNNNLDIWSIGDGKSGLHSLSK